MFLPEQYFVGFFLAFSAVISFTLYYFLVIVQIPVVHSKNKALRRFLSRHVPSLLEPYYPAWFAVGGRLQSGLGNLLRMGRTDRLEYIREVLQLKDGGQLGLDYLEEESINRTKKLVVLLIPGLTSTSNKSHIKTLALTIVKTGAVVVVLNNRGLGGVKLTTPRTYCVTNSEDVQEVIQHLRARFRLNKILALGTSLGGMTLGRYLADYPLQAKETLVAAMLISICWDPITGNANLESGVLNKYFVNATLARHLTTSAKRNQGVLEGCKKWDFKEAMKARTIREYDNRLTAPMFGFASWKEYYTAAQITPHVLKFSVPVFGLTAKDDPMQPAKYLPVSEAEADNSNLALIVTERGGHLGFLEGFFPFRKQVHLMERIVGEFVLAVRLFPDELHSNSKN